jgi:hypothetical protein
MLGVLALELLVLWLVALSSWKNPYLFISLKKYKRGARMFSLYFLDPFLFFFMKMAPIILAELACAVLLP